MGVVTAPVASSTDVEWMARVENCMGTLSFAAGWMERERTPVGGRRAALARAAVRALAAGRARVAAAALARGTAVPARRLGIVRRRREHHRVDGVRAVEDAVAEHRARDAAEDGERPGARGRLVVE